MRIPYAIHTEGTRTWTKGLASMGLHDLVVEVDDADLTHEAQQLVGHIADYVLESGAVLRADETLSYGYWLVRFKTYEPDVFSLWELDPDGEDYVPGVTRTLTYWRDQHTVCARYQAEFQPPNPGQLAVVAEGVMEGRMVDGVRYPAREHMSGWWFFSDQFNGDFDSMKLEHMVHVTAARPNIARVIALPPGFAFERDGEEAHFDQEAFEEGLKALQEDPDSAKGRL